MTNDRPDFSAIDTLRECMLTSLDDLDVEKLKDQVEKYSRVIRETFLHLNKSRLDHTDLQFIQQFLVRHQQLLQGFDTRRQNLSRELKKMKRGRDMQKTYRKDRP